MNGTPEDLERLIAEETEQSELTRDEPLSDRATRRRPNRTETLSIEPTTAELAALREIARRGGVSVSGVARGFIRDGLTSGRGATARRYEELLEEIEDLKDRLSVHEREGLTIRLDRLKAELGL